MTLRRGDIVRVDLGGPDDNDTRGSELYRWCKATASGLNPESEADNEQIYTD
jgi:hypothetical protein